jgi:hypothetical protein
MRTTILAVLLVTVAAAQDFGGGSRRPGAGDYAVETGGALLGGVLIGAGSGYALGLAGWYLGGGPTDMEGWTSGILAGLGAIGGVAIGYPLGCGLGTTVVGRATHADGNTSGAYAGAYIGLVTAIPVAAVAGTVASAGGGSGGGPAAAVICVATLLPAIGAAIGYNTGGPNSLGARLAPPSMAHRTRLGPERQRYSAFDCRLVTVRF